MKVLNKIGKGKEYVYIYYFESDRKEDEYPCKIGKSKKDYIKRIKRQQASMKEEPIIGLLIQTDSCERDERLLHTLLRDKKIETYGIEWFLTNPLKVKNLYEKNYTKKISLGLTIRKHRLEMNMSQIEFSKKAGIRQATLSDIENDNGGTIETLQKIVRALEKEIEINNPK